MSNHAAASELNLLRLLHLADSALPVGGAAHSFGLETLAENGSLTAENLGSFLRDWTTENGAMEAAACRLAHRLAFDFEVEMWSKLNRRLTAMKMPRETRAASMALGRRLLVLVREVISSGCLEVVDKYELHYSTAFGLSAGLIGLDEDYAALALLHQSLANLVSVSQRLLPVGQVYATRVLWELKPLMVEVARQQARICQLDEVSCFAPFLETAAMRHPYLATRLFIS